MITCISILFYVLFFIFEKYCDIAQHFCTWSTLKIVWIKNTFRFLSLRVFGLLSSSLLLFPQRFSQYVLQPSSGVCQTREPSRNFELCPLLKPRGSPVLIPLAWVQVLSIPVLLLACSEDWTCNLWRRLEDISAETLWK